MSESGFNISVGGNILGDVAQTIDKSKHVNVSGDVDTINMGDTEDKWKEILDKASHKDGIETVQAVKTIKQITEAEEEISTAEQSKLKSAMNFLKNNAPEIAISAGELALSMIPGGAIPAKLISAALSGIRNK